jgi:hypothetical protein
MTKNRRQSKKNSQPQIHQSPGAFDVPTVCLNPKRKYTVRMLLEAGYSGGLNYIQLVDGLYQQITTLQASALPPPTLETAKPWKYIKFIAARAWGASQASGKTTVPTKLQLAPTTSSTVKPSSTFIDVATGASDRGFDHINGTPLTWHVTLNGTETFLNMQNVSILDCDVEVW